MYTNSEINIVNRVRSHLEKGDVGFELHFAERTFDSTLLNEILDSFCGITLPENLKIKLNLSSTNVEDDLIEHLVSKLSQIKWPSKFKFDLALRNNGIDDEAANLLFELLKEFDKFPGAEVVIDLDNNNNLNASVIGDALAKITNSSLNGNALVSKDKNKTINFCKFLVEDYLSPNHENDDDFANV